LFGRDQTLRAAFLSEKTGPGSFTVFLVVRGDDLSYSNSFSQDKIPKIYRWNLEGGGLTKAVSVNERNVGDEKESKKNRKANGAASVGDPGKS